MTTIPRSTPAVAAQGPERSVPRDLFHLIILVVPWALFGWLWWRVIATTSAQQLINAGGLVLLVVVVCVPATFLWVLHNVRIFRRKGPRTAAAAASFEYDADWTSRPVLAEWDAVREARVVVVDLTPLRKRFLADEPTDHDLLLASNVPEPPPEPARTPEIDDPREPAPAGTGR